LQNPIDHTIPTYPGLKHNAAMKTFGGYKIALQTIEDVKAGDELFISFGNAYWSNGLVNHIDEYKKIEN
jgi:hypothetical protein